MEVGVIQNRIAVGQSSQLARWCSVRGAVYSGDKVGGSLTESRRARRWSMTLRRPRSHVCERCRLNSATTARAPGQLGLQAANRHGEMRMYEKARLGFSHGLSFLFLSLSF